MNDTEHNAIMMLRDLEMNSNPSHRLMHCQTRSPETFLLNCALPKEKQQRTLLSRAGIDEMCAMFDRLKLTKQPSKSHGVSDKDYGSHQKVLSFTNGEEKGSVGNILLGEHENEHVFRETRSKTGLTQNTFQNPTNLSFCQSLVRSLCDVEIPHPLGCIRIDAMRGARTTPHTDNMRGPTVNLVNFHSSAGGTVNARLLLQCFPAFRTSVVELHGNLFVPFRCTEVNDSLVMIGPGLKGTSHLPGDSVGIRKTNDMQDSSATFFTSMQRSWRK